MAANPAVVRGLDGQLVPAPFPHEYIALQRGGVEIALDNVHTRSGKWSARGTLFVTNQRLVFLAQQPDSESGLAAFDLPLAYIYGDKFNQPIFGCNNLSGKVWPAVAGGGPAGALPPHTYSLSFREGGVGTLLPLYFQFLDDIRQQQQYHHHSQQQYASQQQQQQQQQDHGHQAPGPAAPAQPSAPPAPQKLVQTAFVDPNDPTKIFLTQPVGAEQQLPSAPVYAANYGQEEQYEPMGLRS